MLLRPDTADIIYKFEINIFLKNVFFFISPTTNLCSCGASNIQVLVLVTIVTIDTIDSIMHSLIASIWISGAVQKQSYGIVWEEMVGKRGNNRRIYSSFTKTDLHARSLHGNLYGNMDTSSCYGAIFYINIFKKHFFFLSRMIVLKFQ